MHEDSVKGMTAYDILLNYLQLYVLVSPSIAVFRDYAVL